MKWIVATLAIPLVLAWIAHEFSQRQSERDAADRLASDSRTLRDSRLRTYTELLNKREEADMNVRKEIFSTLLGNYFERTQNDKQKGHAATADLNRRMTVLELLASNFDESLNLSPLFWQLDRELSRVVGPDGEEIRGQLSGLATVVKQRQIDALKASGVESSGLVDLANDGDLGKPLFNKPMRFDNPAASGAARVRGCRFEVRLLEYDAARHRVYATVQTEALTDPPAADDTCVTPELRGPKQWSFWVDEFDFPLISYTRLSTTERFSVVLSSYYPKLKRATVALVYFPSSRSGARDRPFLDTVVDSLNAPADAMPVAAPASVATR